MLMSIFTHKVKLTVILLMATITVFSQRRDSIMHTYYKVDKEATINIDFQHTTLNIIPSNNDSIGIHTRVRVIPTNPNAPYAGIAISNKQKSSKNVIATIAINDNIQPHNELEASCEIAIPIGTSLKLKSRYGIIDIKGFTGQLDASITYSNLTSDTLTSDFTHKLSAKYSSIEIKQLDNTLELAGENLNLKGDYIRRLTTKTRFSMFNIGQLGSLTTESYTDRFILNQVDSIMIKSSKSLLIAGELNTFFQGEMEGGKLTLNHVNASYQTINIANTQVESKLYFDSESNFLVNADMRYCLLKQDQLTLQEITSPNSTLYSGKYGTIDNTSSNLSIISAYGDVSIFFK